MAGILQRILLHKSLVTVLYLIKGTVTLVSRSRQGSQYRGKTMHCGQGQQKNVFKPSKKYHLKKINILNVHYIKNFFKAFFIWH